MRKSWFSPRELANLSLPDLPAHRSHISRKAKREGWPSRPRKGRGGGYEYPVSALPPAAQDVLRRLYAPPAGNEEAPKAAAPQPDQLEVILTLTGEERAVVEARLAILRRAEAFVQGKSRTSGLEQFCELYCRGEVPVGEDIYRLVPSLSTSTLYRWRKALEKQGKAGLVPRQGERSKRKYKTHWDSHPRQLEVVKGFIHKFGRHVRASHIWRELRTRFPDGDVPSRRTVERYVERWFEKHPQLADKITDPNRWKGKHLVSLGRRDEAVQRLAQVWEIDTTPADLLLKYERLDGTVSTKRYALLGIIEVYSRMAALRTVPVESTHAVLSTLRRTILEWRRFPEMVRTDQGAVYTSKLFGQALEDLGIATDVLPPGSPERKPFIERFLGTFNHDIVPQLPGYVGNSVGKRRQLEARRKGLVRGGLLQDKDVVELALTREEFQRVCDNWLNEYNFSRVHSALGCTPHEKAQKWLEQGLPVRGIPEGKKEDYAALLAQLLAPAPKTQGKAPGVRVVRKGHVRVEGIDYAAPEFGEEWNGREVVCRYDETDVSRLFVYDLSMRFICVAKGVEVPGGISRKEAQQMVKRAQSAYMKRIKTASREVLRGFKIQRVVQLLTSDPSASHTQSESVVERLTPAMDESRRAAEAFDQMKRRRELARENDQSTRESIERHEQEKRARGEFSRPQFWDSDAHRFDWCRKAEATGNAHLIKDEDRQFLEGYRRRLGL